MKQTIAISNVFLCWCSAYFMYFPPSFNYLSPSFCLSCWSWLRWGIVIGWGGGHRAPSHYLAKCPFGLHPHPYCVHWCITLKRCVSFHAIPCPLRSNFLQLSVNLFSVFFTLFHVLQFAHFQKVCCVFSRSNTSPALIDVYTPPFSLFVFKKRRVRCIWLECIELMWISKHVFYHKQTMLPVALHTHW